MYHFAAVEDDVKTGEQLMHFIQQYANKQNLEIRLTVFNQAEELLASLQIPFDLILLDIQLPGINGMDLARRIRNKHIYVPIMFITSLAQYAVNGYEVDALDFMVKPITYDALALKLSKAISVINRQQTTLLPITVDRTHIFVPIRQIIYIEVINHNLIIHTEQNVHRMRGSITQMEQQLNSSFFVRISACFLVNMHFVIGMDTHDIILSTGTRLPMSRALKRNVQEKLTEYLGGLI